MKKILILAACFFGLVLNSHGVALAEANATDEGASTEDFAESDREQEQALELNNATNATSSISGAGQFVLYMPELREDASYDFRKVRWGMSPAEVEAAEGKKFTRHDTNSKSGVYRIGYKDVDLFGVDIWLVYSFVNDQLWGAGYAKDYAKQEEFDLIAAKALEYYGDTELFEEGSTREYEWAQGEDTQIILRHVDDSRKGHRIFFNFTCESLSPDPVNRRRMFAP